MSELFTLLRPEDEYRHLEMARVAEAEGIEGLFVSEHVVMGPSANSLGEQANLRDWVRPGMQDPSTPWPSPLIKLAAMAGATSSIRLISAALIAPLRHPIIVAKDMATLDLISGGRFTVMPTVSWHVEEYDSLQIDFSTRGRRLDEHLKIWKTLWQETPAAHNGEFYQFEDTFFSPKPPSGSIKMWFGGGSLNSTTLRRIVEHGNGIFLGFPLSSDDRQTLDLAMASGGRSSDELEVVGWVAPPNDPPNGEVADIRAVLEEIAPLRVEQGCNLLAIKPSVYIDKPEELSAFCRELNSTLDSLFPTA